MDQELEIILHFTEPSSDQVAKPPAAAEIEGAEKSHPHSQSGTDSSYVLIIIIKMHDGVE